VSVLADGAKWIREVQTCHLRDAEGMLDIVHVLGRVCNLGKLLDTDSAMATDWINQAREALLCDGWIGIESFFEIGADGRSPQQQAAVVSVRNYLAPHQHHLHYAKRLAEGRSIGCGQIKGARKNLIGRRLKANASRWGVRRINRMAGLCCLLYSDQWQTYWNTP